MNASTRQIAELIELIHLTKPDEPCFLINQRIIELFRLDVAWYGFTVSQWLASLTHESAERLINEHA